MMSHSATLLCHTMNQLCGDICCLILQSLDISSLYSFALVSVGAQLMVQAYRQTHIRPVSSVECVSLDAAEHGYVEVLGWLQVTDVNLQLTVQHMNLAANQGHQLMVEWLRQQGCPWDSRTCAVRLKMVTSKCSSICMSMVVAGAVGLVSMRLEWSPRSAQVSACQWLSLGQLVLCRCGSQ